VVLPVVKTKNYYETSSTGAMLTGANPIIIILFGIGIAFFVVKNIISFLPKG